MVFLSDEWEYHVLEADIRVILILWYFKVARETSSLLRAVWWLLLLCYKWVVAGESEATCVKNGQKVW